MSTFSSINNTRIRNMGVPPMHGDRHETAGVLREHEKVLCSHCRQVVPAGLINQNATEQFCCAGCSAVYRTLHSCGLDAYYKFLDAADAALKPVTLSQNSFVEFDSPTFHKLYVQTHDNLASTDLFLEGVTCAACVWLVERLPKVIRGVNEARLSLRQATVRITWDPSQIQLSQIARTLSKIGYTPHPARGGSAREVHKREARKRLIHLGVAGAIMGNTMLLALALYCGTFGQMETTYQNFFRYLSAILGCLSLAWPGATFFKSAYHALRMRTTNLDVPIALALLVGGVAGLINVILGRGEIYFDSLSVLVFLLLVGRFIQYQQQRRADDAVGLLFSLTPSSCRIVRDDAVIESPIESLQVGDLVEVLPESLLPADGIIEQGTSSIDQALLTGESVPVSVTIGTTVHAGSQNISSPIRVRVTTVGEQTRVGQLMRLIERGVQDKPAIVHFADKVGSIFLIAITAIAVITFGFWSRTSLTLAIDHTVTFLIVTCPCVLGLATPLTIAIAIGKLARNDILVKSGSVLEKLSRGGELLLDKTGTLTQGRLELIEWFGDESIKEVVAALESHSNHPIAKALRSHERKFVDIAFTNIQRESDGISAIWNNQPICAGSLNFTTRHGATIPAKLLNHLQTLKNFPSTQVFIARNNQVVAIVTLGDQVRDDARASLDQLQQFNFTPTVLSGDAQPVVTRVAADLKIPADRAFGAATPEQKLTTLTRLRFRAERSTPIIMIGDGVNDAAALAAADVGIAVHGGAEASLAAADVYIARPGLAPVVELTEMSRRVMRTIRRNLGVSLAYNILAGTLAATGVMTPMIAAIIMPLSSASVLSIAIASISRTKRGDSWK